MSDLIRREDAIKALMAEAKEQFRLDPSYAYVIGALRNVEDAIRNIPSADRPQAEWIFHYRNKWMVKAECPKCHRRFEFSPRAILKCCPMCETRMKGAKDEVR